MAQAVSSDVGVYRVPRAARAELLERRATVRHGDPSAPYTAELTREDAIALRARGFDVRLLHASLEEENAATYSAPSAFTSYAQMRSDFYAYAAQHPTIAALEVFGTSVQGRELFGLRISGNVGVEENEPELVFWGAIHGSEYAAGEVPYTYALHLLDNYGSDPSVTQFVDSNEIWVIPLINPDGYENGTRNNANNVDLNRDFSYEWDGEGASPAPHSQPETRAVFQFCQSQNITLASTFHCSGNVLFYPWGFSSNATGDAAVIQQVGGQYSSAASYALSNSWADYETHGELLDLVYGGFGGLCFTTEISNVANQLTNTYNRNKLGMDAFCGVTSEGLHGLVTDAQTGQPVRATIWVSGSDAPAYTDSSVGDVHRLVAPGTYEVTAWASGYAAQTVTGLVVASGAPASFQIALERGGNAHAFAVASVNQRDPQNAHANVTQPSWALGIPDGKSCSIGRDGFIVLDMGAGHEIADGPGVDFTVSEALLPGDMLKERYRVYAGDAFTQTTLIGNGKGTWSFDIGAAGLTSVRYLRIEDRSAAAPSDPLAGVEVDAVTVLNGVAGSSLVADTGQISLSAGGVQNLAIVAPTPNAIYWLFTSFTGTTPGLAFAPSHLTLPLNYSTLFLFTAQHLNGLVKKSFGLLDGNGANTAKLTVPPGQDPGLDGLILQHAFLLLDATSFAATFVSNAETVAFVP